MAIINIAASHRFHLLDLARELEKQGHDVKFYSYLPKKRLLKYGLKKENFISLFWISSPFLLLEKITKNSRWATYLKYIFLDLLMSLIMRRCEVYIALGCVYLHSIKTAKKKYNSKTILEWGSKHIFEEINAIQPTPISKISNDYLHIRSLKGYKIADYIAIPSIHVYNSFIKNNIPSKKLILNPYGVDTKMFHTTTLDKNHYDIIMVGGWSFRKGCDKIIKIMENNPDISFLHVGPIVDLEFPNFNNMKHINSVDQMELVDYYSKAKIFLLLSRTEGLAMVQVQALACGLPIVCTKNTGGEDLQKLLNDKEWIVVVENINDENEILNKIKFALNKASYQSQPRSYGNIDLNYFSWNLYGERYSKTIKKM